MRKFKDLLISTRKQQGLTAKELSKRASVSESLLSGLQNGNRRIAEKQASRIANALELTGSQKLEFVYLAMNESSDRLLESSRNYPVEILNSLPGLLRNHEVSPEMINSAHIFDSFLEINLNSGDVLRLYAHLSSI